MQKDKAASRTILFADIAGSTQLYERLGDLAARDLVAAAFDLMTASIEANQGRLVKTIGDEVMGSFFHPDEAATAAMGMLEAVSTDGRLATENILLRIGFHHGPAIGADDDLYGDAVNVAARMTAQAKAGQIITSRQTIEQLTDELRAAARMVDQARVKGKADPIDLFEIAWGQPEELTMMGTVTRKMVVRQQAFMTLDLEDRHVGIDHEHPVVTLGRDQSNRLIINHPKVSRLHARVEFRKNRFVLVDQSTNGTYVSIDGAEMQLLRRDEVTLAGEGYFSLGQVVAQESPLAIRYMCI